MLPAATTEDETTCPAHGDGKVIGPGALGVLINGKPALRVGDATACPDGTVDAIVRGAQLVTIGGIPAARLGDTTSHGAMLRSGSPDVFIGDGSGSTFVPAECAFLNKDGPRLESQYDRIRRPATVSPPRLGTQRFEGDAGLSPALIYDVEIDGHKVTVVAPAIPPPGKSLPSPEQIARSLGAVPPQQLVTIDHVVLNPNPSSMDAYWQQKYNDPNHRSLAIGGEGTVVFFPTDGKLPGKSCDGAMIHEGAHCYSDRIWQSEAIREAWAEAMKADGRAPSSYAEKAIAEDFAESMVMYALSKGSPCEAVARRLFPARYAQLDALARLRG